MTHADVRDEEEIVPRRRSPLHLIPALAMLAATSVPAAAEPGGLVVRVCSGEPGEYIVMQLPLGEPRGEGPGRHEQAPCHAACPAALRETRRTAG
ncbi:MULTISPECIES: hypothetical protein [unclassified Sphingopyxis]|uniref:hypothetical protein n=1 Tax=unclassified Sphingopyxis TaxID=2614943 RepID=UPI000736DD35|nr:MULTISPECIES: hypothetical protein [unclassified Sphingopyxis]KTE41050.1 hypothetical protein ATE62_06650 [Sphingopyxis sp. HIX]KTE84210.1 hypothetical protein ATE72_09705 [Sphingopyxis sp. HXXIV]